jgi:Glycosyltransferase
MKVAIDVTPIRTTGEMGGAFQLVIELIKGLGERYKDDQYLLLTAEWNHEFFKSFEEIGMERICVTNVTISPKSSNVLLKKIIRKAAKILNLNIASLRRRRLPLLKSKGVDVLFCPMSAVNYKEPGISTVSLIYDLQHEYYPEFFAVDELEHRKRFYAGISELADYITCISGFTRQTFIEKLNFPSEKTEVIHISIQDRLKPDDMLTNEILSKYSLDKTLYAYYPANFWRHKNHRMLLVAFSMFIRKYSDVEVKLVFTGSLLGQEGMFNDLLKQMGLEDRVYHLGYVEENEVAALMAGAHFLIFPSLFEGFGIPVVEAMKMGTPVLCSNNTSLPEVGGRAAQYFDPRRPEEMSDLMYRIITDIQLRQSSIQLGYEQIKKFNNDTMVNQYYQLLNRAARNKSSKGTLVEGIYEDNWAKRDVLIAFSGNQLDASIIIEISLPPYVPYKRNKIQMTLNDKIKKFSIRAGESLIINERLPQGQSEISICFSDDFRPADLGMPDQRELAAQITKVHLANMVTNVTLKALHGE